MLRNSRRSEMEREDREILQGLIAKRVGKVVNDIIGKEKDLDEDIRVEVFVEQPSCYVDDKGETHTGRLITVMVDFIEETDGEDNY